MALLDEKICLITGSSRGFGEKTARVMAREGAQVIVTYLEGDSVEEENAKKIASRERGVERDLRMC